MLFLHRDATVLSSGLVHIAFTGKGVPTTPAAPLGDALGKLLPAGVEPAWVEQCHSADVVYADGAGSCGPADALMTRRPGLAVAVVTADCVPVLLAGDGGGNGQGVTHIAAVHAGWRGVAAGIIGKAAARFGGPPQVAWIGPAISAAVYEVGPEVASQVAAASDDTVVSMGPRGRQHVDLRRAVEIQLRRCGTRDLRHVERCTHGDPALWSYRRDGSRAGRNLALIWMTPRSEAQIRPPESTRVATGDAQLTTRGADVVAPLLAHGHQGS